MSSQILVVTSHQSFTWQVSYLNSSSNMLDQYLQITVIGLLILISVVFGITLWCCFRIMSTRQRTPRTSRSSRSSYSCSFQCKYCINVKKKWDKIENKEIHTDGTVPRTSRSSRSEMAKWEGLRENRTVIECNTTFWG